MSVKEAIGELSTLLSIRLITAEVEEMLGPMLGDFKEFVGPGRSGKSGGDDIIRSLKPKRLELKNCLWRIRQEIIKAMLSSR